MSETFTPRRRTRAATAATSLQQVPDVVDPTASTATASAAPAPSRGLVEPAPPEDESTRSYAPSFLPFQLTDEMYAHIIQEPEKYGYAHLKAGVAKAPKFGHIYGVTDPLNPLVPDARVLYHTRVPALHRLAVETRTPGGRRPKLVDGLDWVPSSTANASSRLLRDGETELLRYYCARRTKSVAAQPLQKPFVLYQREIYEDLKATDPRNDTYNLKKKVGEQWRAMSEEQKSPYVKEAKIRNRSIRQRMASADPAELLVRHEMWLQKAGGDVADGDDDDETRARHANSAQSIHHTALRTRRQMLRPPLDRYTCLAHRVRCPSGTASASARPCALPRR